MDYKEWLDRNKEDVLESLPRHTYGNYSVGEVTISKPGLYKGKAKHFIGYRNIDAIPLRSVRGVMFYIVDDYTLSFSERIRALFDVDINGMTLGLTNVHFSNNQYSASQLEETLNILSNRNRATIIAGDFNIFDINTQRADFDDKYSVSTDTASYISFPTEKATLDYILLPKAFHFVSIKTLESISDHNGVLAAVEI